MHTTMTTGRSLTLAATALFAVTLAIGLSAQAAPQTGAGGAGGQAPRGQGAGDQGGGRGDGRGAAPRGGGEGGQSYRLTFPAAQRPAADPAVVARGKQLYDINCRACHGSDLRGGDMGGPNLMRSQLVLNDQNGELIFPVIEQGRRAPGMPAMPALRLPMTDVVPIAAYLHSVLGSGRGGGAPAPALNLVVGNPARGKSYFDATCARCHSATGDLAGVAARIPDVMNLQNTWVAGVRVGGRELPTAKPAIATVHVAGGPPVSGPLVKLDAFMVAIRMPDGTERSFARSRGVPRVDLKDPREGHIALWPTLADNDMHDVTAYLVTLK